MIYNNKLIQLGKLNFELLVQMDELVYILTLFTVVDITETWSSLRIASGTTT